MYISLIKQTQIDTKPLNSSYTNNHNDIKVHNQIN